ncbi:M48 family metallopeptidase [Arenimonas terrae]|uniref:M48 family metallopeptidase n=1 Tax=Arenimonas terrae TaxID=2546226 RepID=A0A5C4RRN5_9GAMM|nr:M48 family metallopeptidase [Arenimonas terrae]TNJ33840.1 M48 family metallopeptidase [Arenimonas terrae]
MDSEGESMEFAAAELTLSPRLGRTVRVLRLPGEGQLQLADSPLLDQWLPTPSRIEGWADWLERRRSAAIGAGIATVLGVVLFFEFALPWMANRLAPVMPRAMERTISDQAMALLDHTQLQPSKLPAERRLALQLVFKDLTRGLPRELDYRLSFRDAPELGPNAFALPDGHVVVTDQLVQLVGEHEDELVAVLAHEAGHHEHRHGMRQALQSSAVVVVAGFLFGDLSGTGSLSVSIPVLLLESGFSRDHEREADRFAFGLLDKHRRSPADFARAMRRLSAHYGERDFGAISYLSTHPPSAERVEAAERAAGLAPGDPAAMPAPVERKGKKSSSGG